MTTIEKLRDLGFVHPETAAAQVNFVSAWADHKNGQFGEGEVCNYNCVLKDDKGNPTNNDYDCDGAASKNPGIRPASYAPVEEIIKRVQMIFEAQKLAWGAWTQSPKFSELMERMQVPPTEASAFREGTVNGKKGLNVFGGNTELYKNLETGFKWCEENQVNSNFTAVGFRIASDTTGKFISTLKQHPPRVFAFSFDHITSVDDLSRVMKMTEEELVSEHNKLDKFQGPRKKLLAGVAATRRILRENFITSRIMWNVVFKHGNVRHLLEMADATHAEFPTVIFNPYPSQSSPSNGEALFHPEDLPQIQKIITWALDEHHKPSNKRFIPSRHHFWDLLEAAMRLYRHDQEELCWAMSGYRLWKCYEDIGAGFYTQMGITGETWGNVQIQGAVAKVTPWESGVYPGLKLACYWNRYTVSDLVRIESVQQVVDYLLGGMTKLAAAADPKVRCNHGCLMGRLMGGATSTWAGMPKDNEPLRQMVIAVRKERVGW